MEKQFRNWSDLNSKPFNKNEVHPYTRCRGILMNGIETEATIFLNQLARHSNDMDVKRSVAATRRIEQQQQKALNWMIPASRTSRWRWSLRPGCARTSRTLIGNRVRAERRA